MITPFTVDVKEGLNKHYLTGRILVEPKNSIYCETNDPNLINHLFMKTNETNSFKIDINISDLLILNQTFVYKVDQNNILMSSFKVKVDHFNFTDVIKLNKIYLKSGYYDILINYVDPKNNLLNVIKMNVTTSKD